MTVRTHTRYARVVMTTTNTEHVKHTNTHTHTHTQIWENGHVRLFVTAVRLTMIHLVLLSVWAHSGAYY